MALADALIGRAVKLKALTAKVVHRGVTFAATIGAGAEQVAHYFTVGIQFSPLYV